MLIQLANHQYHMHNVTYHDLVEENGLTIDFHRSMAMHMNHISEAISKNSKNAEANPQFVVTVPKN